jgi:hypothetical protein
MRIAKAAARAIAANDCMAAQKQIPQHGCAQILRDGP